MCGIVGYIGKKRPAKYLVDILKKLEYRGYDSSGFANLENGKITVKKAVGNISNLEKIIDEKSKVSCAVAHTRWATHGKPTINNAHPHLSRKKDWAVVHNGIIENYKELKAKLKNGENLTSETDTVVFAELLSQNGADDIYSFIKTCAQVEGSFAFVCQNVKNPNTLFLGRRKSPLYCAENKGEILVASDPICFQKFSNDYFSLNNDEFALIKSGKITFYDKFGEKIEKAKMPLDEMIKEGGKGKYPHFMLKEIYEEKIALNRIHKEYSSLNILKSIDAGFVSKFKQVVFVGCGTAYHAGLMGARYMEIFNRIPSSCVMASEFLYNDPIITKDTLYVFVSQSGETADTLRAVELVKQHDCVAMAVTNVNYSTLAKSVDIVFPVCAGPEIAVASTKAYVCQVAVLYLFAKRVKEVLTNSKENYLADIKKVAEVILNFDKNLMEEIADELAPKKNVIFIGKDLDYITANEACLKLKEISYIFGSSYPSGELKHGFLALIEDGTFLVVIANNNKLNLKTYNSANEAISRGAKTILVGNNNSQNAFKPNFCIPMPDIDEMLLPMVSIVPLQYIAYLVSVKKGINPDQPRNLAKSVTVE